MNRKNLDIAHYFANAIVSDPTILSDSAYLQSIPGRIGLKGKDRDVFNQFVAVAINAASSLAQFTPEAFIAALRKFRSVHARDLRSAMKWASRNADIMQQEFDHSIPNSESGSAAKTSKDPALKVFLG